MKCDLSLPGGWDQICGEFKSQLPLSSPKCQVKVYKGLAHALFEVCQGLASTFPHKQAVAHVQNVSPYFEPLMVAFSRSGYQIHTSAPTAEWLAQILTDSLLLLWSDDDPVTGRLYDSSLIRSELKDKRLFRVCVSHSSFLKKTKFDLGPYDIELLSVAPDLCVAVLGERARFVDAMAPALNWDLEVTRQAFAQRGVCEENAAQVEAFEAEPYWERFFKANEPRLFDRAVIYWPDIEASAALELLAEELGEPLKTPGRETRFETTSLCRWGGLKGMQWLEAQSVPQEVIRGLMIFDQKIISPQFKQSLMNVRARLLKLQNG